MSSPILDGRMRRSSQTRQKVVEATLSLIRQGNVKPTGNEIAVVSGVAPRTVFRLFDDLDGLFNACERHISELIAQSSIDINRSGSLHDRIWQFVEKKCELLDARRNYALFFVTRVHSDIETDQVGTSQAEKERLELWAALPEVASLETDARHLAELMLSSRSWDQLRHAQKLPSDKARELIARTIISLIE